MIEINNIVTEIKNCLWWFISKLDKTEERISELEDISIETSKTGKQRDKKTEKKKEWNSQELWDNYKRYHVCVMVIPEEEEREKETEEIFERVMTEDFPKFMSVTKPQI